MDFQTPNIYLEIHRGSANYIQISFKNAVLDTIVYDAPTKAVLNNWITVRDAIVSQTYTENGEPRNLTFGQNNVIQHTQDGLFEMKFTCDNDWCDNISVTYTVTYTATGEQLLPVINYSIEYLQKHFDIVERKDKKDDLKKQLAELVLKLDELKAQIN